MTVYLAIIYLHIRRRCLVYGRGMGMDRPKGLWLAFDGEIKTLLIPNLALCLMHACWLRWLSFVGLSHIHDEAVCNATLNL